MHPKSIEPLPHLELPGIVQPSTKAMVTFNDIPQIAEVDSSDDDSEVDNYDELRITLIPFFVCYAPHRLYQIPKMIADYSVRGLSALAVFSRCRDEFRMQPVENEVDQCIAKDMRTRLFCFYAYYDWGKFTDVDRLARVYDGMQTELFEALVRKYGPEVSPMRLFTGNSPAEQKEQEKELMNAVNDDKEEKVKVKEQKRKSDSPSYESIPSFAERDDPNSVSAVLTRLGIDWKSSKNIDDPSAAFLSPDDISLL